MKSKFFNTISPDDIPFFPYRGGKARIRKYIMHYICGIDHKLYIEPFAGRANVFFMYKAISSHTKCILNDLYLYPFLNQLKNFQHSFNIDFETINNEDKFFDFYKKNEWAIVYEPILFWGGGSILTDTKVYFTGYRGHDLLAYKEKCIKSNELLKNTTILHIDAVSLIEKYIDNPDAFLYIDPPYLNANVGVYNDTMFDVNKMIYLLKKAKCKFIISEYENKIYTENFGIPKAFIYNIPVSPSPKTKTVKRATEVLYSNINIKPTILPNNLVYSSLYPMRETLCIINSFDSVFTFDDFKNNIPKHWHPKYYQCSI